MLDHPCLSIYGFAFVVVSVAHEYIDIVGKTSVLSALIDFRGLRLILFCSYHHTCVLLELTLPVFTIAFSISDSYCMTDTHFCSVAFACL